MSISARSGRAASLAWCMALSHCAELAGIEDAHLASLPADAASFTDSGPSDGGAAVFSDASVLDASASGAGSTSDGGLPDASGDVVDSGATDSGSLVPTDVTLIGTAICDVTAPTGAGSKSLAVISDGVFPAQGSTSSAQQYDTYTGVDAGRSEDWLGYSFPSAETFTSVVFQTGVHDVNGGWFDALSLHVRQIDGTWVAIPSVTCEPPYVGPGGANFATYTLTFPPIAGNAIRFEGVPGGSATFISCGEMRVFALEVSGG